MIVGAVVWGAEDSEATWEVAEKLYLNFTDEMVKRGFPQEMLAHCDMPADVPWLATMYTVGTLNISDISELQWMRGFEIYLAQATLLAN